jgi:hypothetical protein
MSFLVRCIGIERTTIWTFDLDDVRSYDLGKRSLTFIAPEFGFGSGL